MAIGILKRKSDTVFEETRKEQVKGNKTNNSGEGGKGRVSRTGGLGGKKNYVNLVERDE